LTSDFKTAASESYSVS